MDGLTSDERALDVHRTRYRVLASRLTRIGFIWNGSICERWLTCGRPDCECAKDATARHGPYLYWTSKIKGKTVAKLLHSPEAEVLQEWVNNRKELDGILKEMILLSRKAYRIILRVRRRQMKM